MKRRYETKFESDDRNIYLNDAQERQKTTFCYDDRKGRYKMTFKNDIKMTTFEIDAIRLNKTKMSLKTTLENDVRKGHHGMK